MDYNFGKEKTICCKKAFVIIPTGIIALICGYFGVAAGLSHFGVYDISRSMCPWYTQNNISILIVEEDFEKANQLADEVINQNEFVTIAYNAKALYAYSQGDFEGVMEYKNRIFEIAPFEYSQYEEYCYMLIDGITLYLEAGDEDSASVCAGQLMETEELVKGQANKLSSLGKKIKDQPQTNLPEDVTKYIEELKNLQE
jgi:tetratricopeptide (TPR) repeat protein